MSYETRLLRYFALNLDEQRTIRQISIDTDIPYMSLNRIIKEFAAKDIIKTTKQGNSIICSLNIKNMITKIHLILSEDAVKLPMIRKHPLIWKITGIIMDHKTPHFSAVLFGSYAKGKAKKHSDVDLAFITDNRKGIKKIQEEFRVIETLHEIEINVMIFTRSQFKDMLLAKEENVGKQILKNHIILYNPELYWNIVYEARK